MSPLTPIEEITGEEATRTAIAQGTRPLVLRGLVRDWPAVAAGRSPDSLARYLSALDTGAPVDAVMLPPEAQGRIFYNPAMDGFNYLRNRLPLSAVLEQILRYRAFPQAPAVAVQSALLSECAPGFATENRLTLIDPAIPGRLWLGNAITTPTHLDEWNNIACVVAGVRRFTLFPPRALPDLYIGPLDFAPTGAPISLVDLERPDFARFPRLRAALALAQGAELGAGDALYIPPLWWHNVQSVGPVNLLINYWWHADAADPLNADSGFDVLLHAILHLRRLPAPTREAWRALFGHYVFDAGGGAHLPPARRGVLGSLTPEGVGRVRAFLLSRLQGRRRP